MGAATHIPQNNFVASSELKARRSIQAVNQSVSPPRMLDRVLLHLAWNKILGLQLKEKREEKIETLQFCILFMLLWGLPSLQSNRYQKLCEFDHMPSSSTDIKNAWILPPRSHMLSGVM
jgi:hypothetical protein